VSNCSISTVSYKGISLTKIVELFNTNAYTSTIIGDRTTPLSKTDKNTFDPSWNTPAYSVESVDLSLESNCAIQISEPTNLLKLTGMRLSESSTSTHVRQGSLAPFLETKKLKSGLRTYPHVEGFRDPDNYKHWRWGFYYEVKIKDCWKNRSKSVTATKVPIIKQMLNDGASCDRILDYLSSGDLIK
jgi:hypothetical protein